MKINKCIILAGGDATRLKPITFSISKHLLPIYNKPMIYYSISTVMKAGIRNFLIITKPQDLISYKNLLGDGSRFGIKITYKTQSKPKGLPDAFILGKKFIKNEPVCLNLGDHIFFGKDVDKKLSYLVNNFTKSTIFTFYSKDPNSYGVLYKNKLHKQKIIEKPKKLISNKIICGIYFFTPDVIQKSMKLKKSKRGEIEITDLNNQYLSKNLLNIVHINNKNFWFDAGSPDKLFFITKLIKNYEKKFKTLVGSLELIALENKFININTFKKNINLQPNSNYGKILHLIYNKYK